MKNLLVIGVTVAWVYLALDSRKESPLPLLPVTMAAPAAPAPAPQPKVYFHSPLDAPAMHPGKSSGMGYFSTDQDSRFTASTYYGAGGLYPTSSTVYVAVPGTASNTAAGSATGGLVEQAEHARQNLAASYLHRETTRATPNPDGLAR